ncbi:gibberellin-regulated protein 11-like isoform X1 [Argentina anserina]|uniref:gibberellin-regulated protein 11-like isoform X1 n=1 Tax=Argentina anserina TaxID=57926 RepID=UPI00217628A0|nr:gibberellin-regulated protein 11-like isoform X1 [Potentilla anserina]
MMFRALIAQLLVALLTLHLVSSAAQVTNPPVGSPVESPLSPTIGSIADCAGACDVRCGLSSRAEECKRACGTCCARCGCVPPGTSGHYEVCPCYRNMTTHGGRHKCP